MAALRRRRARSARDVVCAALVLATIGCGTPATGTTVPDTSATTPTTTAAASVDTTAPADTTAPPDTIAPTTVSSVTVLPTSDSDTRPLAIDLLLTIRVENEHPDGYSRDRFEHWITQPSGCSTREAVLIRDSLSAPQVDPFGCTVVEGDWLSPYDGATWQYPSDLDIDHVVALKEAWDSGAWAWDDIHRRAFANDLTDTRTLRAVTDDVNQQKSDRDPSNWLPPLTSYWCTYIGDWVAIKARWGLTMDQSEFGRIRKLLLETCIGWQVDPVAAPPA